MAIEAVVIATMCHPDFVGGTEGLRDGKLSEHRFVASSHTEGGEGRFVGGEPRTEGAENEGMNGGGVAVLLEVVEEGLVVL